MKTLYDLLGARPDDDAEALKDASRKAAKANHPIAEVKSFTMPSQRATYDGCCGSNVSGFESASGGTNDDTRHDLLLFTAFPTHRHCERVDRLGKYVGNHCEICQAAGSNAQQPHNKRALITFRATPAIRI